MGIPYRQWTKRITQRVDGMSMRVKLIFSYILIILIPIIFFSIYLFNEMNQNSIAETTRKNEYMLEIEKATILNNMEVMERTVEASLNTHVKEYLRSTEERETSFLVDFKDKTFNGLQYLLFSNPNIANIRMYSNNPNIEEFWPIIFREGRIAHLPWLEKAAKQKGTVWWEINRSPKDLVQRYNKENEITEIYVMVLKEITYADDSHNGIHEVDMEISSFFFNIFNEVQDDRSQMLVIDRAGNIYTNESAEIFKDISVEELERQFRLNGSGKKSYSIDYHGQPYLITQTFIERLDVDLLNVVSMKSSISSINQTRNTIILTTIVLIALLSVVTYFLL